MVYYIFMFQDPLSNLSPTRSAEVLPLLLSVLLWSHRKNGRIRDKDNMRALRTHILSLLNKRKLKCHEVDEPRGLEHGCLRNHCFRYQSKEEPVTRWHIFYGLMVLHQKSSPSRFPNSCTERLQYCRIKQRHLGAPVAFNQNPSSFPS